MKRYKVVKGSQTGHCCFTHTVIDLKRPVMFGDKHFEYDGNKQYDEVCETFTHKDAMLIAHALNNPIRYFISKWRTK